MSKSTILHTGRASLCALGEYLRRRCFFAPLREQILIAQKTVRYRPIDKVLDALVSILCGAKTIAQSNTTIRTDPAVQRAFGRTGCADQSTIARTLRACTGDNVTQLERVSWYYLKRYGATPHHRFHERLLWVDIDVTPLPIGAKAEGSERTWMGRNRSKTGRKTLRITASPYREILHMDGGFGTTDVLNWALSRGYQVVAKISHSGRVRKLRQHLGPWQPTSSPGREMALALTPHRFCRVTRQWVMRTPKEKGGSQYAVLVTTVSDVEPRLLADAYDGRATIEASFCQDKQALGLVKRRQRKWEAQQMVLLLARLAHHLLVWSKRWLSREPSTRWRFQGYGLVRLLQEVYTVPGVTRWRRGWLVSVRFDPLHPLATVLQQGFAALFGDRVQVRCWR